MNVARTVTVVVSYAEIIQGLKLLFPNSLHVQSLPLKADMNVTTELTAGKGMVIKHTTMVNQSEEAAPQLLLASPKGV